MSHSARSSTNQTKLTVDLLKYLNADRYRQLDLASAPDWARSLNPELFRGSGTIVTLIDTAHDAKHGTSAGASARNVLYRIGSTLASADGYISWDEKQALQEIKGTSMAPAPAAVAKSRSSRAHEVPPVGNSAGAMLEQLLQQLDGLVGLTSIEADVQEVASYLKVQQLRKSLKMKTGDVSLHMVFVGNPGTGKTTTARLIAQIYKALGVLSEGQLVETDRAGLVAGYVGQTALKVNDTVAKAIGGVLFIDEAYALARSSSENDFGAEAVETLLKRMEDHRDDLVVIVAGYPEEMSRFLTANPGLASRFNKQLVFDDYSAEELMLIFERLCHSEEYVITESAARRARAVFAEAYARRDSRCGNARFARNIFEQAITNLAHRVAAAASPDRAALMTLEESDLLSG